MAVHDKDAQGNNNQPQKPAGYERKEQQPPQQPGGYQAPSQGGYQPHPSPQASAQAQQKPRAGLSGINQMLRRSGSSERSETRSSEALRALRDMSNEAIATQALDDDHLLIRFDRDQNRVGLSSILVVKTVKTNGKTVACVRPLLLETSDVRLPPRKVPYGTTRIEIPTRPQDVYNDAYWKRIVEFLQRHLANQELAVLDAGPLMVPEAFSFKNEVQSKELLITSVNRCDDAIAKVVAEEPLNIVHLKRDDERLTARIDYTDETQPHDVTGQPIRSDLIVTMSRQAMQMESEDDYYQSETELNSVTAFVNLEYTPQAAVQQPMYSQQPAPQQLFTPTVVITSVRNAPWIRANTPELYMLAISNAYRVTANTAWAKVFLPQVGVKGVDPRDIGALGFLTPAGTRAPTKSDTFEDKDFVDLMQALVRPKPSFLIDVNPVGENSAIENYFIDAAYEGPHQQQAVQAIIQAADNLTGGKFSMHFKPNEHRIVVPYGQEVHMGSYIGPDGEARDIRDLDVLAMLNYTEGNLKEWEDWYKTWADQSELFEVRMQRREQMERHYLSKSLKINGRAVRLMLTPAFVDALDAATYDAGVMVDMDNVSNVMGAQRFMGNQLVDQYTVQGSARMGGHTNPNANRGHNYQAGVTGSGRYY